MAQSLSSFAESSIEIPSADVVFDEEQDLVGEGQFGKVFRAQLKGINVAVKVSHQSNFSKSQLTSFIQEMKILKDCHHPNVVLFMGLSVDSGRIMLVTELLSASLADIIHYREEFTAPEFSACNFNTQLKLKIMTQCCRGVQWLHNGMNIVHRDIKPANFLLDTNFCVKVCDFGFAELAQKKNAVVKGSPLYCAPEVWDGKIGKEIDIYALGITMWELFYEREPFAEFLEESNLKLFQEHVRSNGRPLLPFKAHEEAEKNLTGVELRNRHKEIEDGFGFFKDSVPTYVEDIMESTWNQDASKRIDINQFLEKVEHASLSYELGNVSASSWWVKNFSQKGGEIETVVTFDDFLNAISSTTGVKQFDKTALADILSESNEVNLEFFSTLIDVFGKFFKKKLILKDVIELSQQDWFFNTISKDESQSALDRRVDGTFLIRISTTNPKVFPFTISRRLGGKTTHSRISSSTNKKNERVYSLKSKNITYEGTTIIKLVNTLIKEKVVSVACPRDGPISDY
ncbi:Protein kinase [Entamoeba marina]